VSSESSGWQEDIGIDTDKDKSTDVRTRTAVDASLAELERKYKAQINDLINHHKEETKKSYAKYDRQKEFISIAAHELKSPITPILGALELIEFEFGETGEKDEIVLKKERFDTILRNAKRLERLASEILDVSRINDQSLTLRKEYFNLNQVVLDAIEDFRQQIMKGKSNTQLLYDVKNKQGEKEGEKEEPTKTDDIFVYTDKGRITQVIYNLLDNAIKFTPDGIVSVFVMKDNHKNNYNGEIILSIKDTGGGIHPAILPNLFSIFTTQSSTGTGLGLFISKNIIEAHGGQMWGENNIDGKGATFSFSLPLQVSKRI
jgi:signal transduction histidine kinase